ncbi:mCG21374, isoform CRA_a [Mus musculus]|nr:mCG21374, isoform CRA_a [Mus musculus]EDL34140.1 mCG21374, isoform CRA_a [Mus musculus]
MFGGNSQASKIFVRSGASNSYLHGTCRQEGLFVSKKICTGCTQIERHFDMKDFSP